MIQIILHVLSLPVFTHYLLLIKKTSLVHGTPDKKIFTFEIFNLSTNGDKHVRSINFYIMISSSKGKCLDPSKKGLLGIVESIERSHSDNAWIFRINEDKTKEYTKGKNTNYSPLLESHRRGILRHLKFAIYTNSHKKTNTNTKYIKALSKGTIEIHGISSNKYNEKTMKALLIEIENCLLFVKDKHMLEGDKCFCLTLAPSVGDSFSENEGMRNVMAIEETKQSIKFDDYYDNQSASYDIDMDFLFLIGNRNFYDNNKETFNKGKEGKKEEFEEERLFVIKGTFVIFLFFVTIMILLTYGAKKYPIIDF